jgi:hypothetical protein
MVETVKTAAATKATAAAGSVREEVFKPEVSWGD